MAYRLSIITINYNDAEGLQKTFSSVFGQSDKSFEYIVVDGNSTDNSLEIIRNNGENISKYISEPDSGVYNAMNKGIGLASGEYLLFLNSGDTLADQDVIGKALPFLKNGADLISGNVIYSVNGVRESLFIPPEKVGLTYFLNSFLPHPSTFIRKEIFSRMGLFSENFRIISDWEFFLKAVVMHGATYRKIDLTVSDFDNTGISSQKENLQNIELEKEQVYHNLFPNLTEEIKLLKTADSRRMRQIREIMEHKPAKWKLLKAFLNLLTAGSSSETKSTKKL